MRLPPAHAAPRDSAPPKRRVPKTLRTALSVAVAGMFGLIPAVMVGSPAIAQPGDLIIGPGASAIEGSAVSFTLTWGSVTGNYAISTPGGGTATPGTDYTATPSQSTLILSGTPGSVIVTVPTTADLTDEVDETFTITAISVNNTDTATATGTILDDDNPSFALTAPSLVSETATVVPAAGLIPATTTQKTVTVTATLTAPTVGAVSIPLTTGANGDTATSSGAANRDYDDTANPSTISIAAGQTSGTALITLWDDALDEDPVQYLTVSASEPEGATPVSEGARSVQIGIQDDDATPTVVIGGAGQTVEDDPLVFPLTLSSKSEKAVTVEVKTADGISGENTYGATAGLDYTALNPSTVTFPATTTSALALVQTSPDNLVEGSPEMLTATISNPVNATLGTPITAMGGINDLNTAPTVALTTTELPVLPNATVVTATLAEGSVGEATKSIYLRLSGVSTIPVKIDYKFTGGTATNGTDYRGVDGSVTIAVGQRDAMIPVQVIGDTFYEPNGETFNLVLSTPNASINTSSVGSTVFTITEDLGDVQPTWTVGNVSIAEGNSGTTTARIPIMLSGATNAAIAFTTAWTGTPTATETGTSSGGTVGANDFDVPAITTVTIPAGSTTAYLDVPINGDVVFEKDETATVTVSTASSVPDGTIPTGSQHSGILTIQNDDSPPSITFNETSGTEGTTLRVNATVSGLAQEEYSLKFVIAPTGVNQATAGGDYQIQSGATTVATVIRGFAGVMSAPIADVFLQQDTIDEPVETFGVTASETTATLVGFRTSTGVYRINDDPGDLPPSASISDESIHEDEESVNLTVTIAGQGDTTSSTQAFTIPWWTVDGDAKAGQDFAYGSGSLPIAAGATSAKINVLIKEDGLKEGDEKFTVKLGTPSLAGVVVNKTVGEVTINANDDSTDPTDPADPDSISLVGPAYRTLAGPVKLSGETDPNTDVQLWSASYNGDDWTEGPTMTSSATGTFAFNVELSTGRKFMVNAGETKSVEVKVRMKQAPTLTGSSSTRGVVKLRMAGGVPGSPFKIQRMDNGAWKTVYTGDLLSNGRYNSTLTGHTSGKSFGFRVYVSGSNYNGVDSAVSSAVYVRIR